MPSRRRTLFAGLGAAIAGGLSTRAPAQTPITRGFTIGAGPIGGTYFPVASLVATVVSNPPGGRTCEAGGNCGVPGLVAEAVATQGSVENVRKIVEGGLDSAFAQADIAAAAAAGVDAFAGKPLTQLRALANLFAETVHVVARRDRGFGSVADLRGHSVSLGQKQSGTLPIARAVLAAYGLGPRDIDSRYLSPQAGTQAIREGEIDAFVFVAGQPAPLLVGLSKQLDLDLLPVSTFVIAKLRRERPWMTTLTVPAGVYQGVESRDALAIGAQWLAPAAADEELIYGTVRALFHPSVRGRLERGHPAAAQIRLDNAIEGLAVPLHPGAARFYRERGILKD